MAKAGLPFLLEETYPVLDCFLKVGQSDKWGKRVPVVPIIKDQIPIFRVVVNFSRDGAVGRTWFPREEKL